MSTLHDRLADLADDAPAGGPEPTLWDRGRRLHRRRRAGTAVIAVAVVLALGALGTLDWTTSRPHLAPATTTPGLNRLPDHFYEPPHRLPGTDGHPIGPLVAVLGGDRAGHDNENSVAGISAETGEYRYLDLPDFVSTSDVYLSHDGSRLAYWYGDRATDGAYDARIDGLAVYDTVTGEVVRHPVESRYGIKAEGATWVGSDRIWFGFMSYTGANRRGSSGSEQVVLDPETQEYVGKSDAPMPSFSASYASGGVLAEARGHAYKLWSADQMAVSTRFRIDRSVDGPAWTSPTSIRSVVMSDPDGQGTSDAGRMAAILLLDTVDSTQAATAPIPTARAVGVVGWRDEDHVVILNRDASYSSVEIGSGLTEPLVSVDQGAQWTPRLQVAIDAWNDPTYVAPAPQSSMNPLVVWGIGVAVAVVGGVALVLWRRRVRG